MLDKYYKHELVEKQVYDGWEADNDFKSGLDSKKESYCIVIPPPNVTGMFYVYDSEELAKKQVNPTIFERLEKQAKKDAEEAVAEAPAEKAVAEAPAEEEKKE